MVVKEMSRRAAAGVLFGCILALKLLLLAIVGPLYFAGVTPKP